MNVSAFEALAAHGQISFLVQPLNDGIKCDIILLMLRDSLTEESLAVRIVVSGDCGGPTGDGESGNHTGRKKSVNTPYRCHGRIVPFSTALFASLKAISSGRKKSVDISTLSNI